MTRRHDARDQRPARSKRTPVENAARLAEMATLSEPATLPERVQALFDGVAAERAESDAMVSELSVTLERVAAHRDRLNVIVGLAVAQYEANRAWQAGHREDLWEAWVEAWDRFQVAVAEEAERRGR